MKYTVAAIITILFYFFTQSQAEMTSELKITNILEGEWKEGSPPDELFASHHWVPAVYNHQEANSRFHTFGGIKTSYHLLLSPSKEYPAYCDIQNGSNFEQVYFLEKVTDPNNWMIKKIAASGWHRILGGHFNVLHRQNPKES
ncbi:hypothetical protein PCANC_11766 [Puccinia coronata f. sp. avenae]|jgi:hypothetical protein|uniref:Uncharacterized protein n=1 Tax=Puccinia coronata f. sp. avenae TaxID=200324 RepID=A0A2N5UXY4_9BASI|nr:hypothetical protein PCASD_15786 [Puccinia coronata f. sp. avenae]PLW42619.1 hypothetical protein PCANC_11766 [Puccinia coronata f. sp. avenae]